MQRRHNWIIIAGLVMLAGLSVRVSDSLLPTSATAATASQGIPQTDWGQDALWDDGKAEVATYEAERTVYQKTRRFDTTLITVKEDFTTQFHVKADWPYDGKTILTVLKLNIISEFPTENYPYRYMTSVFIERVRPMRAVKMVTSCQEWCGATFKEFMGWTPTPALRYHSYFDTQGDGEYPLGSLKGGLIEDQLAVSLRSLRFDPGLTFTTPLLESQITNQARAPKVMDATITVVGTETVETRLGPIPSWKVEVNAGSLRQQYWFEQASPNILTKHVSSDGRQLLLKDRTRRDYWTRPS